MNSINSIATIVDASCGLSKPSLERLSQIKQTIISCTQQALLQEVALHPKPGLVTAQSCGAHKDMDYQTFVLSSGAIAPFMGIFFESGFQFANQYSYNNTTLSQQALSIEEEERLPQLLAKIRSVGIEAEQAMFDVTQGINTHKGAIFIFGILNAALGYLFATQRAFSNEMLQQVVKKMCKGITLELAQAANTADNKQQNTHGEQAFIDYGILGIRGEAERGFPILFQCLTLFQRLTAKKPLTFQEPLIF